MQKDILEITQGYSVDDTYHNEIMKFEDYDQAIEWCQEQEIIYYHKAMQYLAENDASLVESFNLADNIGYTFQSINSETLATIHLQDALINSITEVN